MLAIILAIQNETERNAIAEIYRLHYERMKFVALGILHNSQDAEDAAMNALTYMCVNPRPFVNYQSSQTTSLVFLCVKQHAIDLYRQNQLRRRIFSSLEPEEAEAILASDEPSLDEIAISSENRDMLARAIGSLEPMYQIPILLKYVHQMHNTEIASFMHIEPNTVNGRLFRAKKKLAVAMREQGYMS